jgi:hypothetical protein
MGTSGDDGGGGGDDGFDGGTEAFVGFSRRELQHPLRVIIGIHSSHTYCSFRVGGHPMKFGILEIMLRNTAISGVIL